MLNIAYLEVFRDFGELLVCVYVAHARPLCKLDLKSDPRLNLTLLDHLDVLDLLRANQSLLSTNIQKKRIISYLE